jgi:hypothetical protein
MPFGLSKLPGPLWVKRYTAGCRQALSEDRFGPKPT